MVDGCNRVVGMVTRKELLDDWLEERLDHKGHDAAGFRPQARAFAQRGGAHALDARERVRRRSRGAETRVVKDETRRRFLCDCVKRTLI